jgi:1-phosphatidylinositol-3-phosphate 5-kinase
LQILSGFSNTDDLQTLENTIDVLEINHLRQELVHDAHIWDRRLYMMHSLTKENRPTVPTGAQCSDKLTGSFTEEPKDVVSSKHGDIESSLEQGQSSTLEVDMNSGKPSPTKEQENTSVSHLVLKSDTKGDQKSEGLLADEFNSEKTLLKSQSSASNLSERIDLAWTGSGQFAYDPSQCGMEALPATPASLKDDPAYQKVIAPIRIKSFDAPVGSRNKILPVDDPNAGIRRSYSQRPPKAIKRTGRVKSPTFMNKLPLSSILNWEGRLLAPQNTSDVVVPIYDGELSSMIAHAMTVPEYHNFLLPRQDQHTASSILNCVAYESTSNTCSDGSVRSYGSDQLITGNGSKDIHLTVSFEDEDSYSVDKAKFSVTCYFAKQFDAIRRKFCSDELDYIRSLSRCKRWSAQGGKSNAYFAKTLDDRFVIKQMTRTELDSFDDYAAEYFKYLTESVSSGSPTCLTKILGLYQVCIAILLFVYTREIPVMKCEPTFVYVLGHCQELERWKRA